MHMAENAHEPTSELLPFNSAWPMVEKRIIPLPSERAALVEAVGRVLRADGAAAWDLPMADNSAMDGFALHSKDTEEPVNLQLLAGDAYAGSGTPPPVEPGMAVAIGTGGLIPPGADAVLPKEHARREGDFVVPLQPARPGDHIRRAGEELRAGEMMVPAGERLVIDTKDRLHIRLRRHGVVPAKDGSFVIPNTEEQVGTIIAWAWDSTAAVGLVASVRPRDGPFRIQLAEAVPLRGVVRDLPSSMRRARLTLHLVRSPLAFRVEIGEDGTFHVPWLIPGEYELEARNERLRGRIEGPAVVRVDRDAGPLSLRYVPD